MFILRIKGWTRELGKSQGYKGLPIKDGFTASGSAVMTSAWQPSPDELERLASGAPIILSVLGTAHPPVLIHVGKVDETEAL